MMYNYSRTKKSQERLTAADFLLFSDVPKDKRKQRRAAVDRFNAAVAQSRVNRRARLAREEAERTAQQEHSSG